MIYSMAICRINLYDYFQIKLESNYRNQSKYFTFSLIIPTYCNSTVSQHFNTPHPENTIITSIVFTLTAAAEMAVHSL